MLITEIDLQTNRLFELEKSLSVLFSDFESGKWCLIICFLMVLHTQTFQDPEMKTGTNKDAAHRTFLAIDIVGEDFI